ncbi:hypothetical protein DFH07DRAFT_1054728 [Mycena maculata]|uniref:Uncharacterized protein n=1 Tax=Mycena maculata TaxID=230809 RepID=A0AAD7KE34_9AGAR|nr:hypothetical protein DFH07DRAFT_1054728 [Mycena maculata]
MSLHDFDSRAGLETMVLHFGHDSDSFTSHSLSPADGYIMVPKADRVPLAEKSYNVQNRPIPRRSSKSAKLASTVARDISRPSTPAKHAPDVTSLTISISRPCTPFQALPPVRVTSPLRLPSFLDLTLQSLDNEPTAPSLKSKSPSPQPIQLSIEIPSVSHPNSPYVPWPSPVRRNILRPLTPASHVSAFSGYSRPYSRSGARAPEPQEPDSPIAPKNKFLRLSKSFKNLRRTVKEGVKLVKNALHGKKASKDKTPHTVEAPIPSPIPPLPSPVESCESTHTTTLAEWLRQCEEDVERATPHCMTLDEYEERGSWMDLTDMRDESEMSSPPISEAGEEEDEPSEYFPSPAPISPTCTNSSSFARLSVHDIWPTPPRFVTPTHGFSGTRRREMSMPGGWGSSLRDSPASYV